MQRRSIHVNQFWRTPLFLTAVLGGTLYPMQRAWAFDASLPAQEQIFLDATAHSPNVSNQQETFLETTTQYAQPSPIETEPPTPTLDVQQQAFLSHTQPETPKESVLVVNPGPAKDRGQMLSSVSGSQPQPLSPRPTLAKPNLPRVRGKMANPGGPIQGAIASQPTHQSNTEPSPQPQSIASELLRAYKLPPRFQLVPLYLGLFRFPLPFPVEISSAFGWRSHPISGLWRFHAGTDLPAPTGTPVYAAYAGRVEFADWQGGYGKTVLINHQQQKTRYAHLSEMLVQPGQWVQQGQAIARVGSTGNSTGPHLHFELLQSTADGWVAIDSGPQLKAAIERLKLYQASR